MSFTAPERLQLPALPSGQLLYAVGDVHGRADLLRDLIAAIAADAAASGKMERRSLVFLGDYVDRGPDSREVVEILLNGLPQGFENSLPQRQSRGDAARLSPRCDPA